MSLILDALNRSQRDLENRDSVPGLETIHPVETMSSPNKIGIGIALAVVCIAAATALWLLFMPASDSVLQQENRVTLPAKQAEAASPELRVNTQLNAESAPAATLAAPVIPGNNNPQAKSSLATAAVETADSSAVAALYQTPTQQASATRSHSTTKKQPLELDKADPEAATIDIEDVLNRAKAGLENTQLQEHSAPFIAELSQQIKDSIPTIYYSQHDYSSVASKSAAVLNGKRVTAGQSVGGGLRVEEILADSIVLTFSGTEFRLKALNSWVNL